MCDGTEAFSVPPYLEAEEWQTGEIMAGIADVEGGKLVSHDRVAKWLRSWGKSTEGKAPLVTERNLELLAVFHGRQKWREKL
jgi:hypothetical protein